MRRLALLSLLGLGSVACALAACVGDASTSSPPDSGTPGNDAGGTDTGSTPDVGSDVSTPAFSIGGTVHFLQPSGGDAGTGLVLANGTDSVTVTQSGPFTFPKKSGSYDVTVTTNPPGQVCSVRSASGKGTASADVTSIVIGCTIALQSSGSTAQQTTSSKTPVAIPNLAPIAFTNDLKSKALVSLTLPSVGLNNGSYDDVVTAITLDGTPVATGRYGNQANIGQAGHTIHAVIDVPAGAHTLGATWNTYFNFGANTATAYAPFAPQLDIVVLDSLSTFATSASGVGTANTTTSSNALAPMMADVAYSVTTAGPVLALFQAPQVVVGNGTVLYGSLFSLGVDGNAIASSRMYGATQDAAISMVALTTSAAGAHSLRAQWADPTPAYAVTSKAAPLLDAVVFLPTAKTATSQVTGDKSTSLNTSVSIPGLSPLNLTPTVATKALVILHVDGAGGGSDKYAGGEFTVALDNVAIPGSGIGAIASFPGGSVPLTWIQLVPLTAGAHTLQAQYRATNLDLHTGAGTTSLNAILIE